MDLNFTAMLKYESVINATVEFFEAIFIII